MTNPQALAAVKAFLELADAQFPNIANDDCQLFRIGEAVLRTGHLRALVAEFEKLNNAINEAVRISMGVSLNSSRPRYYDMRTVLVQAQEPTPQPARERNRE